MSKRYVHTIVDREMREGLSWGLRTRKPVLFIGPSGIGKTTTIERLCEEDQRARLLVGSSAGGTLKQVLKEIAILFGVGADMRAAATVERALWWHLRFVDDLYLIIDESQLLDLNALRTALNDQTGLPLLFVGNPDVLQRTKVKTAAFEQVSGRLRRQIELAGITENDICSFGAEYNVEGKPAYDYLKQYGSKHSVRQLVDLLDDARAGEQRLDRLASSYRRRRRPRSRVLIPTPKMEGNRMSDDPRLARERFIQALKAALIEHAPEMRPAPETLTFEELVRFVTHYHELTSTVVAMIQRSTCRSALIPRLATAPRESSMHRLVRGVKCSTGRMQRRGASVARLKAPTTRSTETRPITMNAVNEKTETLTALEKLFIDNTRDSLKFEKADTFVPDCRRLARRVSILAWAWNDIYKAHSSEGGGRYDAELLTLGSMFMNTILGDAMIMDSAAKEARSLPREHTPPGETEALDDRVELIHHRLRNKMDRATKSRR